MDEYRARQKAARVKMSRLRQLRLAAEAKAAGEAKSKPGAKGTGRKAK